MRRLLLVALVATGCPRYTLWVVTAHGLGTRPPKYGEEFSTRSCCWS